MEVEIAHFIIAPTDRLTRYLFPGPMTLASASLET